MKATTKAFHLVLTLLALFAASGVVAQDLTITNFAQLAQEAFGPNQTLCIPFSPWQWEAFSIGDEEPWWVDCSQLPCDLLAVSTNLQEYGVQLMPVQLTKNVLTGETLVQSGSDTNVVASVAAPSGYQPGQLSHQDAGVWRMWQQSTNCPDCWGIEGAFPAPTVSLLVYLANINDYSTYESNAEAQAEAEAAAQAASVTSLAAADRFIAMDDGGMIDMDDSDPCTITNESAPFGIVFVAMGGQGCTLKWSSCTDHVYIVEAESSLTPTSSWTDVAWMFGSDQETSWTDTNAVGEAQEFYRVVRGNPNTLNNGVPYGWAVDYGLDPLDPNLASEDPADDGYSNYMKFLTGGDPNQAYADIVVNGGNPYTASQVIPVDPLSTNFPDILISTDPFMSNAVLYANAGTFEYTLANATNPQELYLQYSDAQGQPQGPVLPKVVTLDRTAPVVAITSPPSNAVLNQAFITLQAVAYDPDPLWTQDGRPLRIWINGQPYWDRSGTNINIERFPVPSGTNSFTVTILVADMAGNTNQASQTWTVNTSTATNAPNLLSVNLSASMEIPDVGSIWVEGTVDNEEALVSTIVTSSGTGDVTTNSLNVWESHYEGLVLVELGTNQLVVLAANAAGRTSSNVFTIITTDGFQAAFTSPALDDFAAAPSSTVSGYVNATVNVGLSSQASVVGVLVNGVAASLAWYNEDANGNVPFTSSQLIPLGTPITGQVLTDPPGNPPLMIPPAQSPTYEVVHWEWHRDNMWGFPGDSAHRPNYDYETCELFCANWYELMLRTTEDDVADIGTGDQFVETDWDVAGNRCFGDPDPEAFSWTPYDTSESSCVGTNSGSSSDCSGTLAKSMAFGTGNMDGSVSYTEYCDSGYGSYKAQGLEIYRDRQRGTLSFRAPRSYGTNTTVIFTFEGVDYRPFADNATDQHPPLGPLDLSQVTYRGRSPIAWSNEAQTVSYLISVDGGREYTINQDSFQWPSGAAPQVLLYVNEVPLVALDSYHWLSWTNFHNHAVDLIVQEVGTGGYKPNLKDAAQKLKLNYRMPYNPQLNARLSDMQSACGKAGTFSVYIYQGHAGIVTNQSNASPAIAAYTGLVYDPVRDAGRAVYFVNGPFGGTTNVADLYYLTNAITPNMVSDFTQGQGAPRLVLIIGCESGGNWQSGFTQAGAKVLIYSGGFTEESTASTAINAFFNKLAEDQTRTISDARAAANSLIQQYNSQRDPDMQMGEFTAVCAPGISETNTFSDIMKP